MRPLELSAALASAQVEGLGDHRRRTRRPVAIGLQCSIALDGHGYAVPISVQRTAHIAVLEDIGLARVEGNGMRRKYRPRILLSDWRQKVRESATAHAIIVVVS